MMKQQKKKDKKKDKSKVSHLRRKGTWKGWRKGRKI